MRDSHPEGRDALWRGKALAEYGPTAKPSRPTNPRLQFPPCNFPFGKRILSVCNYNRRMYAKLKFDRCDEAFDETQVDVDRLASSVMNAFNRHFEGYDQAAAALAG